MDASRAQAGVVLTVGAWVAVLICQLSPLKFFKG